MKMVGYKQIKGEIEVLTGLHIGGSAAIIEIGGRDNPIIKHPITNEPYIPGSSIKGKMRALLEWKHGLIYMDKPNDKRYGAVHQWCGDMKCFICNIFGTSDEKAHLGPTRLVVRDSFLSQTYKEELQAKNPFWVPNDVTEIKYENTINRITARANPRNFERVVAGARFSLNMTYWIYANGNGDTDDEARFKHVIEGLQLIELDALGGAGSRGCGQVRFTLKTNKSENTPLDLVKVEDIITQKMEKEDVVQ